jgi:hypothetical protein
VVCNRPVQDSRRCRKRPHTHPFIVRGLGLEPPRVPLMQVVFIWSSANLIRPQSMSWAAKSRWVTILDDLGAGAP